MNKPIVIASDHAGFKMKEFLKKELEKKNIPFNDLGTHSEASVDYPCYGMAAAKKIEDGTAEKGIIVCGSGIGISIAANRFRKVRAALCTSVEMAELSRMHNDSNILALGGRLISEELACEILDAWLKTPFEAGRHSRRVEMMESLDCSIPE